MNEYFFYFMLGALCQCLSSLLFNYLDEKFFNKEEEEDEK